jgi:uncharacterized protein YkwD
MGISSPADRFYEAILMSFLEELKIKLARIKPLLSCSGSGISLALFLTSITALNVAPAAPLSATEAQIGNTAALRQQAEQLFALGNQARQTQGVKPLEWDSALADAALRHCQLMAAAGALSHQYADEADVDVRAAMSGAHFSLIEENVAMGYSPAQIHEAWMNSPHHRDNLLSAEVDRVGFAVVARGNQLYAVADFAHAVTLMSPEQVESRIGQLMQVNGISIDQNSAAAAREACAMDHGMPAMLDQMRPEFIMRWQDAALDHLPGQLLDRMATGKYPLAVVGSCTPPSTGSAFTRYRVAVMLLRPVASGSRTRVSSN